MGVYTHAYIDASAPDMGLTGAFEARVTYNTVKFHWKVNADLITDIPYEASIFYYIEDTTHSTQEA